MSMDAARSWQLSIWDRYPETYASEIDCRFMPVVDGVIRRAQLAPGQNVLDLGTGTGSAALRAAAQVATGQVLGVDISPAMLTSARARAEAGHLANVSFRVGSGEAIPADDRSVDVVLASLSVMFMLDRAAAAHEIARVLRPGGRLVAAVWAGPRDNDLVRFQQLAGQFAPPPVPDVGPGALGNPQPFVEQLQSAGIIVSVDTEVIEFGFENFASAWDIFAGVTAAGLDRDLREQAEQTVRSAFWSDAERPRTFRNATHFVVGTLRG